ncbi:MAG: GNAT family N-acetyltransferase [Bacteroidaceae bacterium]|nr:GNAT family N-acetyltransferase [Bacteroidaceae bacterium]
MKKLLQDETIRLRALELSDIDEYYNWCNDSTEWHSSDMTVPVSHQSIIDYIMNNNADFFSDGEAKLAIEDLQTKRIVGMCSLTSYDRYSNKAEAGIFISPDSRAQNFGYKAITLLAEYAAIRLNIHQLYAYCLDSNDASKRLFKKCGFEQSGLLKDWFRVGKNYENVIMMQKIIDK